MIKNYPQITSAYGMPVVDNQSKSSSSSELVSSFKDMFATMMMANGAGAVDSQSSGGMTDIMAPLMLILLEKMIQLQMEDEKGAETSTNGVSSVAQSYNKVSAQTTPSPAGRPVGGVLTQNYHTGHNGLDFGIPVGTNIKTTMDGKVVYAGWNDQGYGNLVIVENGAYRTYYAHLSSIPVSVGDQVSAGETIGLSGNTGRSTGPHLHYEIRKNNVPIDPTSITLGVNS